MKCPHCGKEFNAGKLMGAVRSEKKAAASRENGKRVAELIADAKRQKIPNAGTMVSKHHTQGQPTMSIIPPKNLPSVVFPIANKFDRGDAKPLFKPGHDKL